MGRVIITVAMLCCLAACQNNEDNTASDTANDTANDAADGVVVEATVAIESTADPDAIPTSPEFVMRGLDDPSELEGMVEFGQRSRYVPQSRPGRTNGKGGEIRFIRLEHGGKAWDDGMTNETGRADQNFLEHVREVTGFKIRGPESIPIASLTLYKRGQAPPFVFLTGQNLAGITTADHKTLRDYCRSGGMIFADNAGGSFDDDFRELMRNVFLDLPLVDIPNDDLIFQEPYSFPGGAPTLQNHGGRPRAWGVRTPGADDGRLCVFYYPGDLLDAWKSGHGGLNETKVASAFKLGMNVIFYAYSHWLDMHAPD